MAWLTNSRRLFPAIIIIGILINRGLRLKNMVTTYEDMTFNDQHCKLKGSFTGAEDFGMGKQSLLFVGVSGGLSKCFELGSGSVENGGVWLLDMSKTDPEPVQLQIQGYPHNSIHVHGIYVSNQTDRLYLINHLGPESTIEVVKISYTHSVTLKHLKTVKSSLFPRYGINDVVEGLDENELYVTRWQIFSMPEHGSDNPVDLVERTLNWFSMNIPNISGVKMTQVYRCDLLKDECSAATNNIFVGSNGMTVAPDRLHYFVADPSEKKIGIFKRQENGWLEFESWIQLPFSIDNLEYDSVSGEILVGTIPDTLSLLKKMKQPDTIVPGGLSVAYLESGEWKTKDILMHDGSKLSQISAGNRYRNQVVLGSPHSPGILVCNV